MNIFENIYEIVTQTQKDFDANKIDTTTAKAQVNKVYNDLINSYNTEEKKIAACAIYRAYEQQRRNEAKYLDFKEAIFDNQAEAYAEILKEQNINEFTISSGFSGFQNLALAFDKNGYKLTGLVEVEEKDFEGNTKMCPACLFESTDYETIMSNTFKLLKKKDA